ncbi:MAG TPA: ABC transporter permease, partial [Planctomycetia bacterium]|nr:ABC transporter permease [Planctomycetia bacterium]
ALQRAAGRKDPLVIVDQATAVRGGRYVDFLVPGLLGSGIMAGGMWGVGFAIVDMRIRKLLKRYLATPMKKRDFLAAILLSRLAFLLPEAAALLVFAYFFFGVTVAGSWLAVLFLVLLGSLAFSGIGLLVACRAKTIEAVSGLMNLVMVPLWICGGIFFSATNFPDEMLAIVRYLPMNAFLDALRPVMIDGLPLFDYWREILILAAWSVVTFALGLRRFRWN